MFRYFRRITRFSTIKDKIKKEKMERMNKESHYFPTLTKDKDDLIRNFGIIAHIGLFPISINRCWENHHI